MNMRIYFAALLLCCGMGAQTPPVSSTPPTVYYINAAGPAIPANATGNPSTQTPEYLADQFYTGGTNWVDPTMGTGIWGTLRFAPSFSYDIPVPNGFYSVKCDLLEPNKTLPGQRIFTITVNGVQSAPIDIFSMTGGINIPTSILLMGMVGNGHLKITFQATLGNAVVSAIEVVPTYYFSGLETHFFVIAQCPNPASNAICVMINPISQ